MAGLSAPVLIYAVVTLKDPAHARNRVADPSFVSRVADSASGPVCSIFMVSSALLGFADSCPSSACSKSVGVVTYECAVRGTPCLGLWYTLRPRQPYWKFGSAVLLQTTSIKQQVTS